MTANAPVQPLSAEEARWLAAMQSTPDDIAPSLAAIRDGHHVVIPVRSEEELRALFEQTYESQHGMPAPTGTSLSWIAWFACARAMGAVSGEKK